MTSHPTPSSFALLSSRVFGSYGRQECLLCHSQTRQPGLSALWSATVIHRLKRYFSGLLARFSLRAQTRPGHYLRGPTMRSIQPCILHGHPCCRHMPVTIASRVGDHRLTFEAPPQHLYCHTRPCVIPTPRLSTTQGADYFLYEQAHEVGFW